jgi:hypothetical protein
MMKFLLKLFQNRLYEQDKIEVQKMKDWLFKSYKEEGFKNYYTMRKKYLVNLLLLDLTDKDRAKAQGKLEELAVLSNNIKTVVDERKKSQKKLEAKEGK